MNTSASNKPKSASDFKIDHLVSGGLITNYFCTSRCRHCLYRCNPQWKKEYIDLQTAEANLKAIRRLGCHSVHIGGGEPFLRPKELGRVLELALSSGVSIEYVETNCSWYKDQESAVETLSELGGQGLGTILVSISPFHNEFIPFKKTKGVMDAAQKAGIHIFPWIDDFISDLSSFDPDKTHSLEEYEEEFGKDYLGQILQRYWIHMGGRALKTFRPALKQKSLGEVLEEDESCVGDLTATTHFHLDLYGNYIPGLCSGLAIAREDLGRTLSEEKYPLLTTLYASGIKGLFEVAKVEYGFSPKRDSYINKCDLCTEIRGFLVLVGCKDSDELNPKPFYSTGTDASDVYRLSPPDIFETLLGEPEERGYDEEALEKKSKASRNFACDRRPQDKEED